MGYVVLARKYRPQRFEDVVGQETAAQTLTNAIKSNRVAHAYLFAGPRGVGKTSMARILARALNCRQGPTPEPCNSCEQCTAIAKGDSIDVIEIDGASNRGIDDARELRENVRYIPTNSRYKIYIIDEVHMLTGEAFNALLKTLEEPPPHVIFILATTEPHKLPETIRSRCQRLDFKRIPTARIIETLAKICEAEGVEIESNALAAIARNARGGLRDSESLLDQLISFAGKKITEADVYEALGALPRESLFKLVDMIQAGNVPEVLAILDHALLQGIDGETFLGELTGHFRQLLMLKMCGSDSPLVDENEDDLARLSKQEKPLSVDWLLYAVQVLADARSRVRLTVEGRIPVEMALIRLAHLGKMVSLDELAQRLENLETALSQQTGGVAARPFRQPQQHQVGEQPQSFDAADGGSRRSSQADDSPAASLDDGTPWGRILAEVGKVSPFTRTALIGIESQSDDAVVVKHVKRIGFNADAVKSAVKKAFNTNARVILKEVDPSAAGNQDGGSAPAAAPAKSSPQAQGEQSIRISNDDEFRAYYDDPAVRNIVKNFSGRIIGVRRDKKCPKD